MARRELNRLRELEIKEELGLDGDGVVAEHPEEYLNKYDRQQAFAGSY